MKEDLVKVETAALVLFASNQLATVETGQRQLQRPLDIVLKGQHHAKLIASIEKFLGVFRK